ncbi:unnamed protein product [Prunus brigantina]
MTTMVAKKVGALVGRVLEVDQATGIDCIGRFLRVRIRFDVGQPLMRGTFVAFPGEGSQWIDFKYEFLPEYCLVCGCLGHPSRLCLERHPEVSGSSRARADALLAFAGLEAVEDLRGRRLKAQGYRQYGGSRWGSRDGSRADVHGAWRGDKVQGAELEDTATSPNKSGSRVSATADSIRRQREEEERNRQLREAALEAGLVFRPMGVGLDLNITVEEQVSVVDKGDAAQDRVLGHVGTGHQGSLTQNSDPFNLGPLIDAAQRSGEGRAKRKSMRQRCGESSVHLGVSGISSEVRRCLPFMEDLTQAAETSLHGSPRTDAGVRRNQLGVLQERLNSFREGCLVMGDFNDILDPSEKDGGRPRSVQSMDVFRGFVMDCNLLDLGYEGYPFTWRNRRADGGIQERLDRGLANAQWLRSYPEARVVHQVVEGSNHAMLMLYTSNTPQRKACRFIFDPR